MGFGGHGYFVGFDKGLRFIVDFVGSIEVLALMLFGCRLKRMRLQLMQRLTITWLFAISFTLNATFATIIAKYDLTNLSSDTIEISSSSGLLNSSNQPIILFPSKIIHSLFQVLLSYDNSANTAHNPEKYAQGIHIQHEKYVIVSSAWIGSESNLYSQLWIFHIEGTIGYFSDFELQVNHNKISIKFNIPHEIFIKLDSTKCEG
jgi:hypothetical protein